MMLGSPIPVQLPYDSSEDRLIVRRQNKLARDIDIIQQKIRNNVYSAAEGNQKIQFKRAEIAQLQRYRGSKRLDTGRLSPAPKTRGLFRKKKKTTKPSNKYNPYAEDKVGKGTEPTGMFSMDQVQYNRANPEARSTAWAEDDRAGMTSQSNQRSSGSKPPAPNDKSALNQRGYSPANYYSRFLENYERSMGKKPSSRIMGAMRKDAERLWNANASLPKLVPKKKESTFDKVKDEAGSLLDKATSLFKSSKSSKSSKSKTLDDNPFGFKSRSKPSMFKEAAKYRAWVAGGRKESNGIYYIPKPKKTSEFVAWNNDNLKSGGKKDPSWEDAKDSLSRGGFPGFGGMPNHLVAQRARANRETALMRKRMGARLNLDNPNMNMTNRSQDSPRQVTRPQESVSNLAGGLTKTRNSMQRLLK